MKRNAFTLIELLGVISILGLIVLIVLPTVEKNIKNSKQKLYEAQISNIESGLRNWATDNLVYLPSENGGIITLTLYQLKQGGYIEKDIINPLTDELFPNDMFLSITKKSNIFEYAVLVDTGTQTGTAEVNPYAPTLLLNGAALLYVELNDTYIDPGVTALDSEGNLIAASNIVTTITGSGSTINTSSFGTYTVKYQVTDPDNGYKTTVIRTVVINDKTKPNLVIPGDITLTPANVLTFNARTGATATDNHDGDLTSQIEIIGNLSVLPGTYYLTYKVTDSSGNTTTAKRKIIVAITYAYYDNTKGVNKPNLLAGMTPVKWSGTAWVNTTADDSDWYNYTTTDKKWANAKTADGSMWVWIPRYAYKFSTGWHSNTAGTIDIKFSMDMDDTRNNTVVLVNNGTASDSNNTWTGHPAFNFGNNQLSGIWVAKFKASGSTTAIDIKPSVAAISSTNVSSMFNAVRNMETNNRYGWGTTGESIDTHLMKNTEWGAAAYLSQSPYGKATEVWNNPSSTFITGCAGYAPNSDFSTGCSYYYDSSNGQQASTTGNVYGIYDMAGPGGSMGEYTAAYINNGNTALTTYGKSIVNAHNRYKDIYTVTTDDMATNYANSANKKGDAIYETSSSYGISSWYSDYAYMPNSSTPWFVRGGTVGPAAKPGIFAFQNTSGTGHSFRPVLVEYNSPAVTFTPYSGFTSSITVSVTSSVGVDNSSLKYIWGIACSGFDETIPAESSFTNSFTNNATLTITEGTFRLWVLAKDINGNSTIALSGYGGLSCM